MKKKRLCREQLDATLLQFAPLRHAHSPSKGWIRAIRDALGMSARQLAVRLGVAQQAVARIERDETAGSVTIKTMRRVAESLDCHFVCGFVPHSTLDGILREQAHRVASRRLGETAQSMMLENQSLSVQENKRVLSGMVDELVDTVPSDLWDES